jgi:cytochrome P450
LTAAYPTTVPYPFSVPDGLELDDRYLDAQRAPRMIRIQMPHGEPAWLATRYADVRLVLGDRRFSRAEALRHDEPRLRPLSASAGLLSMDPPGAHSIAQTYRQGVHCTSRRMSAIARQTDC